jgi:hypothetical protein
MKRRTGRAEPAMPNRITQNQTILSQTKACIAKSLCEIRGLVGYYAE